MDPRPLILGALQLSHGILEQTMADVTPEMAAKRLPGATIQSIATIYAHAVLDEDMMLHGMALGEAPLYATGGWAAKSGVPVPPTPMITEDWAKSIEMNLPAFKEFATSMQAKVVERIGKLTDAELAKEIDGPLGKMTVAGLLTGLFQYHIAGHTGEIAALKGVMGAKGLPF